MKQKSERIINHGGSYVVDKGRHKKVEGTVEPDVSAPRDAQGVRLDRSEAGNRKSEVGNQKSEVRNQKSERLRREETKLRSP